MTKAYSLGPQYFPDEFLGWNVKSRHILPCVPCFYTLKNSCCFAVSMDFINFILLMTNELPPITWAVGDTEGIWDWLQGSCSGPPLCCVAGMLKVIRVEMCTWLKATRRWYQDHIWDRFLYLRDWKIYCSWMELKFGKTGRSKKEMGKTFQTQRLVWENRMGTYKVHLLSYPKIFSFKSLSASTEGRALGWPRFSSWHPIWSSYPY